MRIVTRPDFDGVVCAVLIVDALRIEEPVCWLEPNEFGAGAVDIRSGDVIANLPYHPNCSLWFDHHATNRIDRPFSGAFRDAPSAARIVFDYFRERLSRNYDELTHWADRIDSAEFTRDEVLVPEHHDYVLLSLTVSSESGREEDYWNHLVRLLREGDIQRVMADPEVVSRCRRALQQNRAYAEWLKKYTRIEGRVAYTDFRPLDPPPSGNRFLAYCLFPETEVSLRVRYTDAGRQTVAVQIGHSIFNPGCNVHAGRLLAAFGGGGHRGAASARFPADQADEYLRQILAALLKNQPE